MPVGSKVFCSFFH